MLYGDNNHYSTCKVLFTIMLRTVSLIQNKWQIIGKELKLSDKTLNRISQETCTCNRHLEATHCCIKMLRELLTENKGITISEFLNATKIPFVGLNNVSSLIEKHLKDPECLVNTVISDSETSIKVAKPPTPGERKFTLMIAKVIEHLKNSEVTLSLLLTMLEQYECSSSHDRLPPETYQGVESFSELIASLRKHEYVSHVDLSWLKFLLEDNCPKALAEIEKYESSSIAERILWTDQPKYAYCNGIHLVAVTNNKPECATIGDMALAKATTADFVKLKTTDIITESGGISSVHFHWRILFSLHLDIELPSTVTYEMSVCCTRANITHIGILSEQSSKFIDVRYQGTYIYMYVCMYVCIYYVMKPYIKGNSKVYIQAYTLTSVHHSICHMNHS